MSSSISPWLAKRDEPAAKAADQMDDVEQIAAAQEKVDKIVNGGGKISGMAVAFSPDNINKNSSGNKSSGKKTKA